MQNGKDEIRRCMENAFDLHVHSAPDVMPRKGDDIDFANRLRDAGVGGYVIKSHHVPTADRATLVNRTVSGVRAYGAIALNNFVGGLNPMAVDVAGRLGTKVVWMPTVDAENEANKIDIQDPSKLPYWATLHQQLKAQGRLKPPVKVTDSNGFLVPAAIEILDLIKEYDMVLATGHLSPAESVQLIKTARALRIRRIVVTHPDFPTTRFSVSEQRELLEYEVYFERCYTTPATGKVTWEAMFRGVRETGPEYNVVSTDLGQPQALFLDEGLADFCSHLLDAGFTPAEVHRMTSTNPQGLLQ